MPRLKTGIWADILSPSFDGQLPDLYSHVLALLIQVMCGKWDAVTTKEISRKKNMDPWNLYR